MNDGWEYFDQIDNIYHGINLVKYLTMKYNHSSEAEWEERIKKGEIKINNQIIQIDKAIYSKDLIIWNRSPWEEESVPSKFKVLFDNGDLFIIDKPSGIPVIAGGGFLKHTIANLLKHHSKNNNELIHPKPIHRLGRFTSGVLICARKKETRAEINKCLRNADKGVNSIKRIYRGLAKPNSLLSINQSIKITYSIIKEKHPKLGFIWNCTKNQTPFTYNKALESLSEVKLLEKRINEDLLEINISTGRPHQIRIHLASIDTPLIGDPLYKGNCKVSEDSRPGEGGFKLHSHKIENIIVKNKVFSFEAEPPELLKISK